MEKFRALGLSENVLEALAKKGFETPSEIQEKTIPLLLSGAKDIVGQAQTGTGKTAAFGLPLIEHLDDSNRNVQAIILCPTRELAIQVAEEIISFKNQKRLYVQAVYGGQSYNIQISALKKGVQIVVGTPGRVRDLIDKGALKLNTVTHVVLDEADEMLNMGFEEEVREILKEVPTERRMLLFSATMPQNILRLAKTFMRDYELIEVKKAQVTTEMVDQQYFEVRDSDRFATLCRIIDTEPDFYGIIFCRTKNETDQIADKLIDLGYDAEGIHGDVTQSQREIILKKFKMKKLTILVATDVAARGIDVNDLTHVINYNLPQDPEAYIHRIGRTGRAGKHGTAITIISPSEMRDLLFIQKIARAKLRKEEVPTIEDVIETKKMKIKTEIQDTIDQKNNQMYLSLADELMEENEDPKEIISSLLRYALRDQLNESAYKPIGKTTANHQSKSDEKVRLFVAKGHDDNMNAEKVIRFLCEETGIDESAILDIRVFDKFSFITTPFMEAEQILVVFNRKKGRGRPMVSKAKDRDGGNFGGGNREDRKPFNKEKKFEGGRGRNDNRKEFGQRNDRTERTDRKERSDKKDFGKSKATNTEKPKHFEKMNGDKKPVKRTNKLVDYLDKENSAEKKQNSTKKKEDFSVSFNDNDLSW